MTITVLVEEDVGVEARRDVVPRRAGPGRGEGVILLLELADVLAVFLDLGIELGERRLLERRVEAVLRIGRHAAEVAGGVDRADAHGGELVLDLDLGELRERLAKRRTGAAALETDVGEDADGGRGVGNVLTGGLGLRPRHLHGVESGRCG